MKIGKRILSILLTALLLALNLATAAQAAVSCNGNHEWGNWLGAGATCDSAGSTAMTRTSALRSLRYLPAPEMVPPVPTPATMASTSPAVAVQISGPVVS